MFKAIKKWWNGLWAEEPSPGPKITKEDIARVKDTMEEIRSGNFDRAKPTGSDAECLAKATGRDCGRKFVNSISEPSPVRPSRPKPKPIPSQDKRIKVVHLHSISVTRGVGGPAVEIPNPNGGVTVDYIERPGKNGLGIETEITTVERNGCVARVDGLGNLMPIGQDYDGHEPLIPTLGEPGKPCLNEPVVATLGVDKRTLLAAVAKRLADPQIVKVDIEDLSDLGDNAVATTRKPRRRGKRGGVKRNRRNKNK